MPPRPVKHASRIQTAAASAADPTKRDGGPFEEEAPEYVTGVPGAVDGSQTYLIAQATDVLVRAIKPIRRGALVSDIVFERVATDRKNGSGEVTDGAVRFAMKVTAGQPEHRSKIWVEVPVVAGYLYDPRVWLDSSGRDFPLTAEAINRHLGAEIGDGPGFRMPQVEFSHTDRTILPTAPARSFFALAGRKIIALRIGDEVRFKDRLYKVHGIKLYGDSDDMENDVASTSVDAINPAQFHRASLILVDPQTADISGEISAVNVIEAGRYRTAETHWPPDDPNVSTAAIARTADGGEDVIPFDEIIQRANAAGLTIVRDVHGWIPVSQFQRYFERGKFIDNGDGYGFIVQVDESGETISAWSLSRNVQDHVVGARIQTTADHSSSPEFLRAAEKAAEMADALDNDVAVVFYTMCSGDQGYTFATKNEVRGVGNSGNQAIFGQNDVVAWVSPSGGVRMAMRKTSARECPENYSGGYGLQQAWYTGYDDGFNGTPTNESTPWSKQDRRAYDGGWMQGRSDAAGDGGRSPMNDIDMASRRTAARFPQYMPPTDPFNPPSTEGDVCEDCGRNDPTTTVRSDSSILCNKCYRQKKTDGWIDAAREEDATLRKTGPGSFVDFEDQDEAPTGLTAYLR